MRPRVLAPQAPLRARGTLPNLCSQVAQGTSSSPGMSRVRSNVSRVTRATCSAQMGVPPPRCGELAFCALFLAEMSGRAPRVILFNRADYSTEIVIRILLVLMWLRFAQFDYARSN